MESTNRDTNNFSLSNSAGVTPRELSMRIAMSFPSLIGSLAVVDTGRVSSGAVVVADTRKKFVHRFFQNIERS